MEYHQNIHRITDHQNWISPVYQSEYCRLETGKKKKKEEKGNDLQISEAPARDKNC